MSVVPIVVRLKKTEHICAYPCEDRTLLFNENTEELGAWLFGNGRTEPQIAYWIPNFIIFRGNVTFSGTGDMSPEILVLQRSQD